MLNTTANIDPDFSQALTKLDKRLGRFVQIPIIDKS